MTQADVALSDAPDRATTGERWTVWTLWLTYGAFYFCRTNISAAVPGMKAALDQGGLGLSGEEVGWILASLKIAYGIGQFLNGQLSERFSPRVMLAIGMFGSALLNVLFGFASGFSFLLCIWAMNGVCQSLGWTPCIRVTANWVPIPRRGHSIGLIGTGYQITFGLTYLVAGLAAQEFGWRGALYVPAALLAAVGLFMLVGLREAPPEQSPVEGELPRPVLSEAKPSFIECLYWTLWNPALWLLGMTLGLLNACRYGFVDWGVTHLMETTNMPVGKAVLQYFVIAIGATAGSYLAGWATDRFFGSRRAPVICLLMGTLGCLSLMYDAAVRQGPIPTMLFLVAIGFCIFGPQVLLVGTAPADLAHRGTSAAAAGFVNFMGYLGAATGDVVTGYYPSSPTGGSNAAGWQTAIQIWAAWAFAGAFVTALLWNTTARKIGIFPRAVPRLILILALLIAGGLVTQSGQPVLLQVATGAAILCGIVAFRVRLAAVPVAIIGLSGVLVVFLSLVQKTHPAGMATTGAIVGYGLSLIAAAMILVENPSKT
jgi:sugar phosphate permease